MINQLSPRDVERLSAYLDGALSLRDRASIDQRLQAETALASGLKQLEAVRALLRRAPQRSTQRNFRLDPSVFGARQKRATGGWNSLSLVSAAATFMLMAVLAGDFWASGQFALGAAAPLAGEAPSAFLAQESEMKTEESPTPEEAGGAIVEGGEMGAADFERALSVESADPVRTFLLEYSSVLEISLGVVAILAGILALQRRQQRS